MFLWLPVFLSLGIGGYFSMPREPGGGELFFLVVFFLGCAGAHWAFFRQLATPVVIVAIASGFVLAKVRTESVRAPIIAKAKGSYWVEGKIEKLVLLPGEKKRLILVDLSISRLKRHQTPARIRIVSRIKGNPLYIGSRVKLKAVLRPPPGPVRPQGFDFARQSWFAQVGAVGFAISKIELAGEQPAIGIGARIERFRQLVAGKIRAVISGPGAEVSVALIVGEKRSIDKEVLASIRAAGLAHMLAISGMHMALVSGTTYWVFRAFLALSSTLALLFDVRKIAAVLAIGVAGGYLLLSGMSISTLRAFIMVSIMFVAILLGRRALSLRNVSVAALLILVFRPESLLDVGFQMSFASVIALVSFYEAYVRNELKERSELVVVRAIDRFWTGLKGIFLTTLVAGLAVAPIAIYHFHHITTYSVVGNLLAMPVLTMLVMPMALVGLVAMVFDLHALPLHLMGQGNSLIITIAQMVAGFTDARVNVGTISLSAFLIILSGGLWLCLWKSFYRYFGLLVILTGIALSPFHDTPFLLIERDGKNIVLIDKNKTMWPMSWRVARYSLDRWKSAYGASTQTKKQRAARKAAARQSQTKRGWRCELYGCTAKTNGLLVAYSRHPGTLVEDCANADILVASYPVPKNFIECQNAKLVIDKRALKRNGSYAVYSRNGQINIFNARQIRGERPWSVHN
ncbi:MAG: ComEC family competence protein [Hyphomicrobiaceae bacterium]|nr:ComEC family competence protein [Hyphomicrobiaceae bacterium]